MQLQKIIRSILFFAAACTMILSAKADIITFSGLIVQSTSDTGNSAVNNPDLNNIQDLDPYTVTLTFANKITAPGVYTPTKAAFSDSAAGASENSFGSLSLTITLNAGFDEFSFLGCLTTGTGCAFGNQLTANFKIPAASLNLQNVAATGLDQPHPLDLLEDDGVTDIHGSITMFSGTAGVTAVPEPGSVILLGTILVAFTITRTFITKETR